MPSIKHGAGADGAGGAAEAGAAAAVGCVSRGVLLEHFGLAQSALRGHGVRLLRSTTSVAPQSSVGP